MTNIMGKKKRRKTKRTSIKVFYFSILLMLLVLLFTIYYLQFFFPKILNNKIKEFLKEIYKPVLYEENGNIILKFEKKPDENTYKTFCDYLKDRLGLEVELKKVTEDDNKGVYQLVFLKNKRRLNELITVFIFWDDEIFISEKRGELRIPSNRELNDYEKIEIKKIKVKKDNLIEHKIDNLNKTEKNKVFYGLKDNKKVAKIAIVIDDAGYNYNSTFEFLKSGIPLTFAYIPDIEKDKKIYNLIKECGYDLMLHIPMEPEKGKQYVEKNAIFTNMKEDEIKSKILKYLEEYPDVIGCNNHMGSKAVKDVKVMNTIFDAIKEKNIFWLDSRTTSDGVVGRLATLNSIKFFKRDVFLDNEDEINYIRDSMEKLIKIGKKNGSAIGIGHIQSKNLIPVLKEYYNNKDKLGIQFVSLKDLY